MSGSITPPGGGAANPPPIQSFAQAIAQVTQIPAQLRNQIFAALQTMTLANALSNGGQNPQAQVQGQVIGKDQNGATLIKTDAGTVGIRTQLPLPQGASVTLQIGGTQQAPQAVIVQVQPPVPPTAAAPAPTAAAPLPQPAPQPAPTAAQQPATNIAATAQAPQPSVQATATVVGPPPNAPAVPVPQTPAAAQAQAVPTQQTAPQTQTAPSAAAQQMLQTGTSVQIRVLPDTAPVTPQQAGAQPAPVAARSQFVETLTARVVAHTPGGQTLVDSSLGRLAMTWPAGVPRPPEGTRLALEVTVPPQLRATAAPEPTIKSAVPLAHEWPNLKEALKSLAAADPALARRVVDEGLPRPGPKLALQVLSYIATDRTDARSLLGTNVAEALDRAGRGDVLQRLDVDLREMQRQSTASTDWRAVYVPIYDGQDIRQMRLFSRREDGRKKGDRESKRFIVELDFSELGEVQIDGLMRKPRLELMLRTHREIPRDMRDELEVVFLDGCTLAGLAGKIYFQATDRFPVAPLDEIARKDRGVIA